MKPFAILLLLISLSVPATAASLAEARRFADLRAWPQALAEFDALLARDPANADLLIEAARVYGWADRNREAAQLYQRVVAVAPSRLPDVRGALAWQLLWSGQAQAALPMFEAELAARPHDPELRHGQAEALLALDRLPDALAGYRAQRARFPDDLRARKGEARVLLWMGQAQAADQAYRAVLQASPGDREARFALGRLANQRGEHQRAAVAFGTLLRETEDADIRLEWARALRWSGDDSGARAALAPLGTAAADDLRAALRRDSPQRVRLHAEAARDSDALFTRVLAVEAGLALGDRQSLEASVRQAWLSQRHARLDGRQAMLGVGARFGEAGAPGGLVFPSLQLGGWDYDGWQHAAWRARLKWLPADGWRWDFEAGNTPIENIDAIRSRVRFDYLSAGFDHRFAPRWQMSLGALGGRFDDGNQRLRLSGRLETRLGEHPRLTLGVEGMGFADSRPPSPGRGYWSPDHYRELKLAATVEHDYAGWNLYLKGAVGRLWETPGARTPLYLVEAAARHPLGDWGELRVYAGYSDSAAWSQSSGGYWRGYYGLTFNVPF